jgi:hypothetical protein
MLRIEFGRVKGRKKKIAFIISTRIGAVDRTPLNHCLCLAFKERTHFLLIFSHIFYCLPQYLSQYLTLLPTIILIVQVMNSRQVLQFCYWAEGIPVRCSSSYHSFALLGEKFNQSIYQPNKNQSINPPSDELTTDVASHWAEGVPIRCSTRKMRDAAARSNNVLASCSCNGQGQRFKVPVKKITIVCASVCSSLRSCQFFKHFFSKIFSR